MNNQNAQSTIIYFDNAATTRVSDSAIQKAVDLMKYNFGNPSSAHSIGLFAEKEVSLARKRIITALGFEQSDGDLFFTSGGTEANNLALIGTAQARKRLGNRIIVPDSEHASVYNISNHLANEGFDVVFVSTKNGKLDLNEIEKAANENCILISCMLVNNETGAIYDIAAIDRIRKQKCPQAYIHTDAVQAFCKEKVSFKALGSDLVTVSGHKIHAPMGVGALYVKKGVRIKPILFGGGQEKNLRPGTESVPSICAFGLCAEQQFINIDKNNKNAWELYNYLENEIKRNCPEIKINKPQHHSPYIASLVVPNIRSEIVLRHLSDKGIFVSAGSACSSKSAENRVLAAYGLSHNNADSTIRISFCDENTKEEIDMLVKGLNEGLKKLVPAKFFKKEGDLL